MKKYYFLVIVLTIIALWPFLKPGFFESDDGEWMVIRFTAFHQALIDGQFPIRFVDRLNNNYGYPVMNFLYPLPFYLAEIPKTLGFGFVDSIKIVFIFSTITSVVTMFWALSQVFAKTAAFGGAILYIFAPYRFVDLYVRGSIGENLAFTFMPLILGSIFKAAKGQKVFFLLNSVATACLILSHNVIAIIFIPFAILLSIIYLKKFRIQVVASFVLGILASAFFWIPALYDLRFVRLSQIKVSEIADYLLSPRELVIPHLGFEIGIVTLFLFASYLYLNIKGTKDKFFIIFYLTFIAIFFLMTRWSSNFWTLPLVDTIQFPWRLLSLVVFMAAYVGAFIIHTSKRKMLLSAVICLAAITSTILYTKPATFTNKGDDFYSTNEATTNVKDEYLPLWVKEVPSSRASEKIKIISGNTVVEQQEIRASRYKFRLNAMEDSQVQINTIYFPGHRVVVDGKTQPIDFSNKYGLINFQLPKGSHEVIIKYDRSPIHLASEILSIFALAAAGAYYMGSREKLKYLKLRK